MGTEKVLAEKEIFCFRGHGRLLGRPIVRKAQGSGGLWAGPYRVIMCSVAKIDVPEFVQTLKELENKMILFGHADYPEFCVDLKGKIAKTRATLE